MAFGANNLVNFYLLPEPNSDAPAELLTPEPRSYLGSVQQLRLNTEYAAALFDGKIELHWIEAPEDDSTPESVLLPQKGGSAITCMDLTTNFCIYGDALGGLTYFLLEDWKVMSQFKHVIGIKKIFADATGTRVVFFDDKGDVLLYTAVNDAVYEVGQVNADAGATVLWDNRPGDQGTFALVTRDEISTYVFRANYYTGPRVDRLGTTPRDPALEPLLLLNGTLHCLSSSGRLATQVLGSHDAIANAAAVDRNPKRAAQQYIALGRFREALAPATAAQDDQIWGSLCSAAVHNLAISTAIHAYRACGKIGMVHTLASIQYVEDRNLLCGHVCLLQKDIDKAEGFFLDSARPVEALVSNQEEERKKERRRRKKKEEEDDEERRRR